MKLQKQTIGEWKFKAANESDWLPAQVPGCVHTDLLRNGKIPDPFYGTNERELQWIDKSDWEYEAVADVDDELFAASKVELVFDGLDTYADVTFNGERVLSADNMFRSWRVDVKRLLRRTGNRIHIRFRSPIAEDVPKLEALGYALPATNDQSEHGGLGERKVSVFARKAPYHYGWDWGPRFVTSGIWREARLEGWSEVRIRDVYIRQNAVSAEAAMLTAVVEAEAEAAWEGTLALRTGELSWSRAVRLDAGTNAVELDAVVANPRLWWCRGLGEPHLYEFEASLLDERGREAATAKARTGLRAVKVVRERDDAGTSFSFELNGVPVFAKGANHIPNDSFVTEVTYERYRHEIASAVEANMNMLRVWGGGIYEDRTFYDLCDEHGILVWQDFMFACSMYPGDEAFLTNVKLEAEENVKRLRNHPSIALWCGNNEIDVAWSAYVEDGGWGWKQQYTPEQREKLWRDYETMFHRILPDVVSRLAPGVDYWPSSPLAELSGDAKQHSTRSSKSGDIHYWGVWHAVEPIENYNVYVGRFMSEYGFQSFPEYKSVRTYAEESDMELLSDVMLSHQRNNAGNRLIKEYMDIYMKEAKDFPSFLYMSQLMQAEAMKMAFEAHRRHKPFCMGTLYWQMNDCWPVASWASMDYYGRWKATHYYAARSFRDVAVSVDGTSGARVDVYLLSDVVVGGRGTLRLTLADFRGGALSETAHDVELPVNAAKKAMSLETDALLAGRDPSRTVLLVRLEVNGAVVDAKEHYFAPSKSLALEPASIQVEAVEGSGGTRFTLSSDTLAKQVWLSSEAEGIFSDNFFDLVPGFPVTVEFRARTYAADAPAFAPGRPGAVEVRSMIDFVK